MKKEFEEKLAAAVAELSVADEQLAELLRQIRVAPRAEKTTVGATVRDALARLSLARNNLLALQALIATDDD